ncbi:hypothetical protein FRB95_007346 [Tulasnella sp. JGI-2019a]|nr:hypothetical protein FRB95_007346 [Tulasnella sp. JGI-2019a]
MSMAGSIASKASHSRSPSPMRDVSGATDNGGRGYDDGKPRVPSRRQSVESERAESREESEEPRERKEAPGPSSSVASRPASPMQMDNTPPPNSPLPPGSSSSHLNLNKNPQHPQHPLLPTQHQQQQQQQYQRPVYPPRNTAHPSYFNHQSYTSANNGLPQTSNSSNGSYSSYSHPTSQRQSGPAMHPPQQIYSPHPPYARSFSQSDSPYPSLTSTAVGHDLASPAIAALSTPETVASVPSGTASPVIVPSVAPGQGKRKRKDAPKKTVAGSSTVAASSVTGDDDDADKKRTKTTRACDPCRRKKIRCDVIEGSEPPICAHCKQYHYECTFFLPISETRFKKKKMEEAAVAAAASVPGATSPAGVNVHHQPVLIPNGGTRRPTLPAESLSPADMTGSGSGSGMSKDVKILGPTSLSFILHSTPSIPVRAFQNYDARYHQTWEVGKSGDGFIKVRDNNSPPSTSQGTGGPHDPSSSNGLFSNGVKGAGASAGSPASEIVLNRDMLATLINDYFREIYPQFPVITEAEFLSNPSPPPVLLYAICSVAAARRSVPKEVFESLRAAVNQIIRADDVLSTASIVNVQALLILGMCGDAHSVGIQDAMTAAWLRLGAVSIAQDLGLCRAEAVKKNIESRRRIWGACVVADRWYGACFGHPFMIDVLDCDVRLPTPDDPNDASLADTKPQCYLAEMIKLSILLGKVTKTIYSPSGLVHATDTSISQLLAELDHWKSSLHPSLVYKGPNSILPAGLLHLFYTCVCMMFWRVFMRLSYTCPAHLKFSLTVERWTELQQWSRESIEWLDRHETCFDSWMFVSYAASAAALIQYHTWARRRDLEAVKTLKLLKDCVQRWESSLQPGHMAARRKTAEIVVLLYEATQQMSHNNLHTPGEESRRLNPTVGVSDSAIGTVGFRRLKFTKDPSRPGGGVFIADEKALADLVSDVPLGTVVLVEAQDKNGDKTGAMPTDPDRPGDAKMEDGGGGGGEAANSKNIECLMVNIAPLPSGQTTAGTGTANASTNGGGKAGGYGLGGPLFGTGTAGYGGVGWGMGFGHRGDGEPAPIPGMIGQGYSTSFPANPHSLAQSDLHVEEQQPQHQVTTHPYQSMMMGFGALSSSKPVPTTGPVGAGGAGGDGEMMNGNVNPTMNYNYAPPQNGSTGVVNGWSSQVNGGGVQVLNLLDQPLDGNVGAYQALQGIPFDAFAAGWDEYFARIAGPNHLRVLNDAAQSAVAAARGASNPATGAEVVTGANSKSDGDH